MSRDLEKCPRSLLVFERSNFMNENSRHDVDVFNHKFNYKISLLIPDSGVLPVEIEKVISNFSTYYLVRDLPVYKFLEEKFLETVVKTDRFLALSYKTQIDEENVIAFLPGGKLILSVDKDTYQQLGLEGKPLQCNHKKLMKYVITVDLTDKSLCPGTKRYQHVLSGLKERVPLRSDFLLTRCRPGEDKDEAFQGLLSQYTYEECRPTFNSRNLKNLLCPSIHSSGLPGKSISCTPNSFLEWLGAVNLNITNDSLPASFLSSYVCPEPCSSVSEALLCTVTGLIPPENVYSLIQELRQLFEASQFTSWVSLTVHGFMDSPVSWRAADHGLTNGGENFYNFVCFKNQDYWLHMPAGLLSACPT